MSIGFWEPVRMVDVTRTPFCMVGLGGIALDPGLDVPRGAHVGHDSQTRNSFYHAHWYANPILTWLEVLLDFRAWRRARSTWPISPRSIRCGPTTSSPPS